MPIDFPIMSTDYLKIAEEEEKHWQECYDAIVAEIKTTKRNADVDFEEAKRLTAEIVNSRREEDQQQLMSDEAVAHGLSRLREGQIDKLELLLDQPYFARIECLEGTRKIAFKLGMASFPNKRIIDWREAPISRLYYEYREGDEYEDDIAGQYREGKILVRRGFKGKGRELLMIECADGQIIKKDGIWNYLPYQTDANGARVRSRGDSSSNHLPPILSLITPDQYQLITSDQNQPLLIEGIAGSGKTTVALHRLSWLVAQKNYPIQEKKCVVIVFNQILKMYIKECLPELGLSKVLVNNYADWVRSRLGIQQFSSAKKFSRNSELESIKYHNHLIEELDSFANNYMDLRDPIDIYQTFWSEFFNQENIIQKFKITHAETLFANMMDRISHNAFDHQDYAIMYYLSMKILGANFVGQKVNLALLDHMVVDEIQDLSPIALKGILASTTKTKDLTLVGDFGQQIYDNGRFHSFEDIVALLNLNADHLVKLNLSFRSTRQILELAQYVRHQNYLDQEAKGVFLGPEPQFLELESEQDYIFSIQDWVNEIKIHFPNSHCAVLCKTSFEASQIFHQLQNLGVTGIRLGNYEHFSFDPGVTITSIAQVKGLEFRHVLVTNPSLEQFRDNSKLDRNLLYVAITRAEEKLDFIVKDEPTNLLPANEWKIKKVKRDNEFDLEEMQHWQNGGE